MSFISDLFAALQQQTIYSLIIFTIVLPAILLLRKRYPVWTMGLCCLVLLRLILPLNFEFSISLRALLGFVQQIFFYTTHYPTSDDGLFTNYTMIQAAKLHHESGMTAIEICLFALWAVISSFLIMRFFMQRNRYIQLIKYSSSVRDTTLIRSCARWRARFGINRTVRLVTSNHCQFIFTIGTLKPVIFIPRHLLEKHNHNSLDAAIAHETAHIKRYDDLWIIAQHLIQYVYFFNPIVWICNAYIKLAREQICDHLVLNKHVFSAKQYSQSIINILKQERQCYTANQSFARLGNHQRLVERFSYIHEVETMKTLKYRYAVAVTFLLGLFILPLAANGEVDTTVKTKQHYMPPVKQGWISSGFGKRKAAIGKDKGKIKFHKGIDIANQAGTKIYAIASGVVKAAGTKGLYGNRIEIQHTANIKSVYAQLQSISVSEGEKIQKNSVIGLMGSSGQSTGPHLHFELIINGEHVNPADYIKLDKFKNKK